MVGISRAISLLVGLAVCAGAQTGQWKDRDIICTGKPLPDTTDEDLRALGVDPNDIEALVKAATEREGLVVVVAANALQKRFSQDPRTHEAGLRMIASSNPFVQNTGVPLAREIGEDFIEPARRLFAGKPARTDLVKGWLAASLADWGVPDGWEWVRDRLLASSATQFPLAAEFCRSFLNPKHRGGEMAERDVKDLEGHLMEADPETRVRIRELIRKVRDQR